MKKFFTFFIAVLASAALFATTVTVDGIKYNIDETNFTAEVGSNSHSSYSGDFVIPEYIAYDGVTYAVTGITSNAFYFAQQITSVTIPSTITSVDSYAFYYCTGLVSATINCSEISSRMFYYCSKLNAVTIGSNVTKIGSWAFDDCPSIFSLTVPNTVTTIGSYAFDNVPNVNYSGSATGSPWGAKYINGTIDGDLLFSDATKTTLVRCNTAATGSITIPNTVTTIKASAFYNCTGITSVSIPSSVTSIGSNAFSGCTSLPVVDNIRYADTYLVEAVDKKQTSYTIQSGTKWIGYQAFQNCTNLTSITIPNSVTTICQYAFYGCTGLFSLTVPSSVATIENYAFNNVPNVNYSGSATGSPWGALCINGTVDGWFIYTDATKTTLAACNTAATGAITIPNKVTSIGERAFYNCTEITSVSIPSSVTSIGNQAFYNCKALTTINIPSSVTSIGSSAFGNCTSLPVVDNIRYADTYLIGVVDKNQSSYTIKSGTKWIGYRAFEECYSLTSITIPSSVTNIDSYAFEHCSNLESAVINSSVIGDCMFEYCYKLSSVIIGSNVTKIGSYAFDGCSSIFSLTVPNTVSTIGSYAFNNLPNVNYSGSATGSPWGAKYINGTIDGWLLYSDATKTTLVRCDKAATGAITIPNTVTTINASAFYECVGITSVSIPNSVTSIGSSAFSSCIALTTITIPSSVTSIGSSAFNYCKSLTAIQVDANNANYSSVDGVLCNKEVTTLIQYPAGKSAHSYSLPASITTIGNYAFGSDSLQSVVIGENVTAIGRSAFYNCSNISSVTCKATTPPSLDNEKYNVFPDNWSISKTLYVPAIALTAYQNSDWAHFFDNIYGACVVTFLDADGSILEEQPVVYGESAVSPQPMEILGYTFATWSADITNITADITVSPLYTRDNIDGLYYTYDTSNNTAKVDHEGTNYAQATDIIIPKEFEYRGQKWTVTGINDNAFTGCSYLKNLTIPGSMLSMGQNLFNDCYNMETVTFKGNVPYGLNASLFANCINLSTFYVPCGKTTVYNRVLSSLNVPIVEAAPYTCVATSSNDAYGTVYMVANYACPTSTVTLTATPTNGCHFVKWSDEVTATQRTITLTQDTTLVGIFAMDFDTTSTVIDLTKMALTIEDWYPGDLATYNESYSNVNAGMYSYDVQGADSANEAYMVSVPRVRYTYKYSTDKTRTNAFKIYPGKYFEFVRYNSILKLQNTTAGDTIKLTVASRKNSYADFNATGYPINATALTTNLTLPSYYGTGADEEGYVWTELVYVSTGGDVQIKEYGSGFMIKKIVIKPQVPELPEVPKTYGIMVNGTTFYAAVKAEPFDGFEQYYLANMQFNAGDMWQLCESGATTTTWAVDLDASSVTGVMRSGDWYYVTASGCYDIYIKLKYQQDQVYVGYGTDCGTVTPTEYNVYASVSPDYAGYVDVTYTSNHTKATVTAVPYTGYHFTGWSDGVSSNPRTLTLTKDVYLTAYFEQDEVVIAKTQLVVNSADEKQGYAYGSGVYEAYTYALIFAITADNYNFAGWSDGNYDNPRRVYLDKDTMMFTANFTEVACGSPLTYVVDVTSKNPERGSVTVEDYIRIEAIAAPGYAFAYWNDGNEENPRFIKLDHDITLRAIFSVGEEGLNNVPQDPENMVYKVIINDQVYVIRGDKTFTLTGQEVK